jgi:ATP-binding cassette subfamily F protein uup
LEAEIEDISRKLEDADLYGRDPTLFQTYSARLPLAEHELEVAETRWLELEDMRSSLA